MEIAGIPVSTNFEPLYLAPCKHLRMMKFWAARIKSVTDGADEAKNWPLSGKESGRPSHVRFRNRLASRAVLSLIPAEFPMEVSACFSLVGVDQDWISWIA